MNFNPPFRSNSEGSQAGFTLIEVMISMVIMVFISLGIYQMTTETYHLRDVLSIEGAFYNTIRMSMDIVQRDVSAIYSPSLMRPAPTASANPTATDNRELLDLAASDVGKTTTYWQAATEKSGIRNSHFVGSDTKMSFVSTSHIRIYRDSPESDFAKISYEVVRDDDTSGAQGASDTQMLVKTESPDVFDDDERRDAKYQRRYTLLHGLKKFKIRYWKKDTTEQGVWSNSWDSDKEEMKDRFPDVIEITFEAHGGQQLTYDGIFKFRPEVPLRGLDPSS
jgi:prepilin-type N-terminal cleavage/methylation domain-containing protein